MSSQHNLGSTPLNSVVSPYATAIASASRAQRLRLTEAQVSEQLAQLNGSPQATNASLKPTNASQSPLDGSASTRHPRNPLASRFKQSVGPSKSLTPGKQPDGRNQVVSVSSDDSSSSDSDSDSNSTDVEQNDATISRVVSDMPEQDDLKQTVVRAATDGPLTALYETEFGRPYLKFPRPNGTVGPSHGILFPGNYRPHRDPEKADICPVRNCRLIFPSIQSLGGHFGAGHCGRTWNDNNDGTLTQVGTYSNPKGTSPGIVVSRNPLPPNAPPPVTPTEAPSWNKKSSASQSKPQTPVPLPSFPAPSWQDSVGLPPSSAPPGPSLLMRQSSSSSLGGTGQWKRQPSSSHQPTMPSPSSKDQVPEVVEYLHNFLAPEQEVPHRWDIDDLVQLTRQRDLPDAWLRHHNGNVLDFTTYACAVAYLVGNEVTGETACPGPPVSSARLSVPCVTLPDSLPPRAREAFSKTATCVGCKYICYIQRQSSKKCRVFLNANKKEDQMDVDNEVNLTPVLPSKRKSPSDWTGHGSADSREHRREKRVTRRVSPDASDGTGFQMEAWELAPGRFPSGNSAETFAWSGAYMTQGQPTAVADDVGFNVIVIHSGCNKRWEMSSDKMRVCYVAEGKLRIKMGSAILDIGRRGTFKIAPGQSCVAENRQYDDAEISCTTINNYEYVTSPY